MNEIDRLVCGPWWLLFDLATNGRIENSKVHPCNRAINALLRETSRRRIYRIIYAWQIRGMLGHTRHIPYRFAPARCSARRGWRVKRAGLGHQWDRERRSTHSWTRVGYCWGTVGWLSGRPSRSTLDLSQTLFSTIELRDPRSMVKLFHGGSATPDLVLERWSSAKQSLIYPVHLSTTLFDIF